MLQITPTIRVRSYDEHQYVIEILQVWETGERWQIVAYVLAVNMLPFLVRRIVGSQAAEEARKKAVDWFDASPLGAELAQLPPKVGKPKRADTMAEEDTQEINDLLDSL